MPTHMCCVRIHTYLNTTNTQASPKKEKRKKKNNITGESILNTPSLPLLDFLPFLHYFLSFRVGVLCLM